ncbi:hypothetical protein AAUPMC_09111, partial [Pasteurella multocida subsp. multocida str. Anand1_cattle]
FVIVPLFEIAPDLCLPSGQSLLELMKKIRRPPNAENTYSV